MAETFHIEGGMLVISGGTLVAQSAGGSIPPDPPDPPPPREPRMRAANSAT